MRCLLLLLLALLVTCAPAAPVRSPRIDPPDAVVELGRLLPRSTPMLWVAREPRALVQKIGLDRVPRRLRQDYEKLVFRAVGAMGKSPLDWQHLGDMGVDVRAPIGVALLDPFWRDWAVVVPAANPARLRAWLYALALAGGRRDGPRIEGDAVLLELGDEAWAVCRDRHVLLVLSRRAEQVARQLAAVTPAESLARHDAFRAALRGRTKADVVGYLDARALIYAGRGMDPRWPGHDLAAAARSVERGHREALAEARRRGFDPEELVELDDEQRRIRTSLMDDAVARQLRAAVGELDGVGVAVDVRRSGVDVHAAVNIGRSTLRRLFKPAADAPRLAPALRGVPVASVRASLDMAALLSPDFAPLGGMLREGVRALGLGDPWGNLGGELAFAATLDPDAARKGELRFERLGYAALVQVRDDATARGLVDGQVQSRDGWKLVRRGGAWRLERDEWLPLHMQVSGGLVTASTDPGLAGRLARAATKGHTRRPQKVLELAASPGLLAALWLAATPLDEAELPRFDDEPDSQDYRVAMAELRKVVAEASRLEGAYAARRAKEAIRLAKRAGVLELGLALGERGFELTLRHATLGGTPLQAAVDLWDHLDRPPPAWLARRRQELADERAKLESQTWQLREEHRRRRLGAERR